MWISIPVKLSSPRLTGLETVNKLSNLMLIFPDIKYITVK